MALIVGWVGSARAQQTVKPTLKPGMKGEKSPPRPTQGANAPAPQATTAPAGVDDPTFVSPDGDTILRIEEVECGLWCDFASPLTFGGPILGSLLGVIAVTWLHVRAVRGAAGAFRGSLPLLGSLWVQPLALGLAVFAVFSVLPAVAAALFTDFRALWLVIVMRPPFQIWSLLGFLLVVFGPYGYAVARTSARAGV